MTPEEFTAWLLNEGPEEAVERLKRAYTKSDILQVGFFEDLVEILLMVAPEIAVPGA